MGSDRHDEVQAILKTLSLPPGVSLRPWQEADFPAIQRLSQGEGWPTPIDRPFESLASWQRSWPTLVAVAQDEVIGFCRALSDGAVTTYIAELLVAPGWQRQGIATALLETSQRLCPYSRLDLLAMETSHSFYEHIGFRPFYGFRLAWGERQAQRS